MKEPFLRLTSSAFFLFFISFFSFSTPLTAQTWDWIEQEGGPISEQGNACTLNHLGDLLVTGFFSGFSHLWHHPVAGGGQNLFLAKYDSLGSIVWVKDFGGTGEFQPTDIAVDLANFIYVTGYFSGKVYFNNDSLTSNGGKDLFVAKFSPLGLPLWYKHYGGTSTSFGDEGYGLSVLNNGDFYLTGHFQQNIDIEGTLLSASGQQLFLAFFDSNGNNYWAKSPASGGSASARGIAHGAGDDLYLTGNYSSTVDFGGQSLTAVGAQDVFLARYDDQGNLDWVRSGGGAGVDQGNAVALSPFGTVSITGYVTDSAVFDTVNVNGYGSQDFIIAQYDTAGTLRWIDNIGESSFEYGQDIQVDRFGNVIAGGHYLGGCNVGGNYVSGAGAQDFLLVAYDHNGTYRWNMHMGGTMGDYCTSFDLDPQGKIFYTGYFALQLSNGDTLMPSFGISDVVVGRILPPCYPPVYIEGPFPNELCDFNEGRVRVTVTGNGLVYNWFHDGTPFANPMDTLILPGVTAVDSGDYWCDVTGACGTLTTPAQHISIIASPQPVMNFSANTLSTGTYLAYQWNENGIPIPFATNQTYIPQHVSMYSVSVMNAAGCWGTSPEQLILGREEEGGAGNLSLFPNPVKNRLEVQVEAKGFWVRIWDARGILIHTTEMTSQKRMELNFEPFPSGIYLLEVISEKGRTMERVVKE